MINGAVIFLEGTRETGIEQKNVKRKLMREIQLERQISEPDQISVMSPAKPNRTENPLVRIRSDDTIL